MWILEESLRTMILTFVTKSYQYLNTHVPQIKKINNSQYKAPAFLRFKFQCFNVALKFKYQGTDGNKIKKR